MTSKRSGGGSAAFVPTKKRCVREASQVSTFAAVFSDHEKGRILRHLLDTNLTNAAYGTVLEVATDHRLQRASKVTLLAALRSHSCTWNCLIRNEYKGISDDPPTAEDEVTESNVYLTALSDDVKCTVLRHFLLNILSGTTVERVIHLALEHGLKSEDVDSSTSAKDAILSLTGHSCNSACRIRPEDALAAGWIPQPEVDASPIDDGTRRRHNRQAAKDEEELAEEQDIDHWKANWPQVASEEMLKEILGEHLDSTSADALRRESCSFCNRNEPVSLLKYRNIEDLDITLLEAATARMRSITNQPQIQSHRLVNGRYNVCHLCWESVKGRKFMRLPLASWANGCWIGDVPPELACLSYAEEMVIARAHSTKCWAKLNGGKGNVQRAASGNVCIHPHEITNLAERLPRPINTLYDEIVVIFVSENREATADMFKHTPFLVRRTAILAALLWLKRNNVLYADITIDDEALAGYPDPSDDNPSPVFPVQFQDMSATVQAQSATYTGHGIDTTEEIFATEESNVEDIPISRTGMFDVDRASSSLNIRKIEALRYLKENGSFLKTSRSEETVNVRTQPDVYGLMWPTLFPYGVGLPEDPLRSHPVQLHHHAKRLLQLTDRRFQTHISFIFVIHNILMMRRSSHRSRLAVRRSWWSSAMDAMQKIDLNILNRVHSTLSERKARKDYSRFEPSGEGEAAVMKLLRFVDCVDDHIEGSTGEIKQMREEIRAISRKSGTPAIFFTLNPADAHNPITSFFAGTDINIDAPFSNPDSRYTSFDRARNLASNPVAGAEFFHLMANQFVNTFMGFNRRHRRGVFGRIKHYYGVVEAQNRGSLHIHMLIWLEGSLSPSRIQERCTTDDEFKSRLFQWLESVFCLSLPPETQSVATTTYERLKRNIMGRPPHPSDSKFDDLWPQYLREVLDASGQRHSHNETCFKKLPISIKMLSIEDQNRLCRFNLPADTVSSTSIDTDGKIHLLRPDGSVVGYVPVVSGGMQCNTDAKFVGSGAFGMALAVYMSNYTAKSSLDSAVMVTALLAALTSLQPKDGTSLTMEEEQCRRLLLKTLNQANARRELSGQQVAASILGYPNHLTDSRFSNFYWTKLLTWLSTEHFPPWNKYDNQDDVDIQKNPVIDEEEDEDNDSVPLDHDDLILLNDQDDTVPPQQLRDSLIDDVLFRPLELEDTCMWTLMSNYEKVAISTLKKSKTQEQNNDEGIIISKARQTYSFLQDHPQVKTHVLRRRSQDHIPVILGYNIPRRDVEEQTEKYSIAMLALFSPWRRDIDHPLKDRQQSWNEAGSMFQESCPLFAREIMDHFQEQWECRKAADDFSLMRRTTKQAFMGPQHGGWDNSVESDLSNDIDWQLGQEGPAEMNGGDDIDDSEDNPDLFRPSSHAAAALVAMAKAAQLYQVPKKPIISEVELPLDVGLEGIWKGTLTAQQLEGHRRAMLELRSRKVNSDTNLGSTSSEERYQQDLDPRLTNLAKERAATQSRLMDHLPESVRTSLTDWQELAITLCRLFTLNRKQRLAFLLLVDHRMACLTDRSRKPFRLIIGGSGGTGKSHVYDALKAFYAEISCSHELTFTAPTGISADNINGSTSCAVFALRTDYQNLVKPNSPSLKALAARLEHTRTFIIDEFFFMGCSDFEKVSRFVNLALGCTDDAFGNLSVILSGDEFQLAAPQAVSLYDQHYANLCAGGPAKLQALNDSVRRNLTAFKNYRAISNCVVFDEIVCQQHTRFVSLLERLRRGICTTQGTDSDLDYLKSFCLCPGQQKGAILGANVLKWVTREVDAAPLITYTNAVRDAHNWNMTEAFASATGQEFCIYYAEDTVGSGSKSSSEKGQGKKGQRTVLTGQNARDAWNTPIKKHAKDLTGRLPLAIGMPIIIVDNLAVELGVCNGSRGTLVGIEYYMRNGRRYAVSAEVDIPKYRNPNPKATHPTRVTIPTVAKLIHYEKMKGGKLYSARRQQLPLIGGFAFTVYNSQSQSIPSAILHVESCKDTASVYVMLSRIKCGEEGPLGMKILGEVAAKKISTHAAQEVRAEEKRLKELAGRTLEQAQETLRWYIDATQSTL